MMLWAWISFGVMGILIFAAIRNGGPEVLGMRQACYLGALCFLLLGSYNVHQHQVRRTASDDVAMYVPVYPTADVTTRVPIREMRFVERLFSSTSREDEEVQSQWIFDTEDSVLAVGRFYRDWSKVSSQRVGVDIREQSAEILVDEPGYAMSILAQNHWGKTRITYTLMTPL